MDGVQSFFGSLWEEINVRQEGVLGQCSGADVTQSVVALSCRTQSTHLSQAVSCSELAPVLAMLNDEAVFLVWASHVPVVVLGREYRAIRHDVSSLLDGPSRRRR
eukprot:2385951-Rhodomonas_salina.1